MKARRKGPISIAAATASSLSAIVATVGAAQVKDSADASVGGLPIRDMMDSLRVGGANGGTVGCRTA